MALFGDLNAYILDNEIVGVLLQHDGQYNIWHDFVGICQQEYYEQQEFSYDDSLEFKFGLYSDGDIRGKQSVVQTGTQWNKSEKLFTFEDEVMLIFDGTTLEFTVSTQNGRFCTWNVANLLYEKEPVNQKDR